MTEQALLDEVDALIDRLLADTDVESEFGRARAYRRIVHYAEEHLAASQLCNLFLLRGAERLGQPPLAIPIIHNRVPVPDDARLAFYYHEEEGPVLVGNAPGLHYLAAVLAELSEAPLPGENIVLPEGYEPFVGDSYGLTIYNENEEWFDAYEEGVEDQLVAEWESELNARIVSSEALAALQLTGPVPGDLQLSPQKLYRLEGGEPWSGESSDIVRKPYRHETDRVRVFSLHDDDGRPFKLAVDLDDPDVTFYYDWHLEQFAGDDS